MPKVLVGVFCSEEIEAQEQWLDVPGRWFSSAAPEGSASGF